MRRLGMLWIYVYTEIALRTLWLPMRTCPLLKWWLPIIYTLENKAVMRNVLFFVCFCVFDSPILWCVSFVNCVPTVSDAATVLGNACFERSACYTAKVLKLQRPYPKVMKCLMPWERHHLMCTMCLRCLTEPTSVFMCDVLQATHDLGAKAVGRVSCCFVCSISRMW